MKQDSNNSTSNLITVINIIGGIIGLFLALVSVILRIKDLVQDTQMFRLVSMACFIPFLLAIALLAFKTKLGQAWRRKLLVILLVILYLCSCFFFLWVGTWITPVPKPVIIDTGDNISLWSTGQNEQGTPPTTRLVPGKTTNAYEVSYTLSKDGWVGMAREISSAILTDTRGIRFFYKGNGAPNTIELKLICKPDSNGKSAVFSVLWNHATNAPDWTSLEAPYRAFVCWTATGCQPGDVLDPNNVWKIDIAISNKTVDTPGSGVLLIDDIQGFR